MGISNNKLRLDLLKMSRRILDCISNYTLSNNEFSRSLVQYVINEIGYPKEDYDDAYEFIDKICENLSNDEEFLNKSKRVSLIHKKDKDMLYYRLKSILNDSYRSIDEIDESEVEFLKSKSEELSDSHIPESPSSGIYGINDSSKLDKLREKGGLCLPKMTMGNVPNQFYVIEVIYNLNEVIPGFINNDDDEDE